MTAAYTVPAFNEAVISTITVCNQTSGNALIRAAVRPNGANISTEHYFVYDATITGNETFALTFGITMDSTDVLDVYSDTANVSFSVFGSQIAP
jgi:hypothetical protein